MTKLTAKEHRKRHRELHAALDEIAADFVSNHPPGKGLSNTIVMELLEWSKRQREEAGPY